ncbi:unnamed protein product, partial [Polarella glacialis]
AAARRAIVACLGDASGEEDLPDWLDVIFEDDGSEARVKLADAKPLELFEAQPASCRGGADLPAQAARCREEGNVLFRLGDSAAAAERYAAAIAALGRVVAGQPGHAPVLVLVAVGGTLWAAELVDAGARQAAASKSSLRLLRAVGGRGLPSSRGGAAPPSSGEGALEVQPGSLGDLQASLYLNRSRCWLALGSAARAVQDTGIAAALRRSLQPDPGNVGDETSSPGSLLNGRRLQSFGLAKLVLGFSLACAFGFPAAQENTVSIGLLTLAAVGGAFYIGVLIRSAFWGLERPSTAIKDSRLCTAHFLRGRARLVQGRVKAAEADFATAKAVADGAGQLSELRKLQREIAEVRRGNKRLAKEVARWCDAAMARAGPDAFAAVASSALAAEVDLAEDIVAVAPTAPPEHIEVQRA